MGTSKDRLGTPQRLSSVEMAAVRGEEELVQISQQQLLGPAGEGCQVSEVKQSRR